MIDRFTDRRVIITGAGSGIGAATVARLLDEGATVAAFDISAAGLKATAAAADEAGTAKRLTTGVLDISREDDVIAKVDAAVADLGGLDVLVNVAGMQTCSHTHETTLEDWNRTLAVNLTGTFLMTRQALPALLQSGRGVVINFTSTSATYAHPYMAAYAASSSWAAATPPVVRPWPPGCSPVPSAPAYRSGSILLCLSWSPTAPGSPVPSSTTTARRSRSRPDAAWSWLPVASITRWTCDGSSSPSLSAPI
ncbi:SAM-dependent methyltransferase [Mycolicibacterium fluoranthenivorans]|uniref:SAM-dependent methyltransferase n=1 Tax=Mycolicibacterium fluoranthenivorans TaxID=258505 RepID=A0A7X5U1M4_9MYCO|nr:SAM-dependent methyltransferase [Mycolicibacterium fluoranthenivorans]